MERRLSHRRSFEYWRRSILHISGWLITILFFSLFWLVLSFLFPVLIPMPIDVARYILGINKRILFLSILRTLFNSFLGFLVALIISLMLGFLGYMSEFAYIVLEKVNKFVQSISVLIWVIVAIMIFGVTSFVPPIIVTATASFPILFSSTVSGIQDVDSQYNELAKLIQANKNQAFRHIILPGLIPYLTASSRSALGVAIRISVVAEAFGAAGGIGYQLIYSYDLGFKEGVFAWAIMLIFLMIVLDAVVLQPIERWGKRWM